MTYLSHLKCIFACMKLPQQPSQILYLFFFYHFPRVIQSQKVVIIEIETRNNRLLLN